MEKIIFLIFLIFIVGCTVETPSSAPRYSNEGRVSINIMSQMEMCNGVSDATQRDVCYSEALTTEKNTTICDKFSDFDLTIKCYADVAASTKNANVCIPLKRDDWRDSCYFAAAVARQDPLNCGAIVLDSKRRECYDKINISGMNAFDVCPNQWTSALRTECFEIFKERK